MPRAFLTRAVEFSAGHRYRRPEWDKETNLERFGKAAREGGHGHNYRVEVRVCGDVDPRTGMVVDLGRLDAILEERVVEPFDHAFLNDLPAFAGDTVVPTTENIARVVWNRVEGRLPRGCSLSRVRVREDRNLWSEYEGG